jgi:flagellar protein FlaG
MSINSIPVNADNNFMLNRLDNSSVNGKDNKVKTIIEKQSVDAVTEQSVEKPDEKLTVAERIAQSAKKQDISAEDVEKALDIVASFLHSTMKQVDFSSDNSAGKTVITVIDKETQEVINQFPSEKIVSMAEKIQQLHQEAKSISGLLIDRHV